MSVLLFNQVVYSNQVDLYKILVYNETTELVTRILDRIEQTEGYDPGKTPVAISGSLNQSLLLAERPVFSDLPGHDHMINQESSFGRRGFKDWIRYIAGYNINYISNESILKEIDAEPSVREMPLFPAANSVTIINGVVVVKLS